MIRRRKASRTRKVRKSPLTRSLNTKSIFKQGYYIPKNPQKYKGDLNNIIYRSSWELRFNEFLDNNENILEWMSEEIWIPYLKPTDNKIHKYYPDYFVKFVDSSNRQHIEIIEVKPASQIKRPRKSKNPKTALYEDLTYAVNLSKWKSATEWCNKRGIKFRLLTEHELFL